MNDEGKRIWGKIFTNGEVPVLSPQKHEADLGGKREQIFIVAWDELTPVQRAQMINYLAEKFKASTQSVENQILKDGLPLRASLVSCIPIPRRFF